MSRGTFSCAGSAGGWLGAWLHRAAREPLTQSQVPESSEAGRRFGGRLLAWQVVLAAVVVLVGQVLEPAHTGPSPATLLGYGYNQAGLLQTLTDWSNRTTTFGYDIDGNRTSIIRPNGVTSTIGYDPAGRITSILHTKGASTLQSFAYSYYPSGNRETVAGPGGTEFYTYDPLDRLTQVAYPGGPTVSYAYDSSGNRLTQTTVSGNKTTAIDYAYDAAGRLTTAGSIAYTHDQTGNLLTAGSDTFSWDFDGRLASAKVWRTTVTYTYDGDGVRVGSKAGKTPTTYLVDREGGLPTIVDDGTSSYLLRRPGLLRQPVQRPHLRPGRRPALGPGPCRRLGQGGGDPVLLGPSERPGPPPPRPACSALPGSRPTRPG